MLCKNCNTENNEGAPFCKSCGVDLTEDIEVEGPETAQAAAPVAPEVAPPVQPPVVPTVPPIVPPVVPPVAPPSVSIAAPAARKVVTLKIVKPENVENNLAEIDVNEGQTIEIARVDPDDPKPLDIAFLPTADKVSRTPMQIAGVSANDGTVQLTGPGAIQIVRRYTLAEGETLEVKRGDVLIFGNTEMIRVT